MNWPRRAAVALALVTASAVLGVVVGVVVAPSAAGAAVLALALALAGTPTVLGLLVARRRPEHAMGPLLAATGLTSALQLSGEAWQAAFPNRPAPGWDYLVATGQGTWVLWFVPIAALLLFFPDGRLSSRANRWLLAALLVDAAVFMVVATTAPGPYLPPNQTSPHVLGTMPAALATVLAAVTLPGLLLVLVLCVASLIRHFRRGDDRLRAQIKWLALAGMALPVTLLGTWAGYLLLGQGGVPVVVGLTLSYVAVPTVITIAVLRPDLYDVDRLIASTVTHAGLSGVLLALFTVTTFAGGLLIAHGSTIGAVGATAICALVLTPLRHGLQRTVDHRLYPARQAAIAAVERLRRRTATVQERPEQLQAVLREALADPTLRVGLFTPDSSEIIDINGMPLSSGRTVVPVVLGDEQIGVLSSGGRTSRELLREVASFAAPLVEVVRLRLELRQALHEVEKSRARLLHVGYEERRRLERDLHDGAQQRLVCLGMALRLAQRRMPRGGVDLDGVLDEAVAELGTAVSELRQLAHGIRPSHLAGGLPTALSALTGAVPVPVELHVTATQLTDDLETTAYYVVSEAISNAVKHAHAERITINVHDKDQCLRLWISDDGVGGAVLHEGSGLSGLADRVAAQGGTLRISSPAGGGTTVEATLPCTS